MPWRGPDEARTFPSLGDVVVAWIEAHLCHGPGDVLGEPIHLDDELYTFVVRAYRLDATAGRRQYRRAFLSRPKGRAKSELAGMLVCAEALGPVRFDGWDANGDPVGRPVRSPFIRALATEESQTGHTYEAARVMLEHVAENFGDDYPGLDIGLTRTFLPGGGLIVPSTASNASKDGGRETFAVFDETHLYLLPELRRMHATVRRNLRKRRDAEPWSLETSTMYVPGANSVAEATHEYAKAIAEGKAKDRGLLFDHREAPADTDLTDRDSLVAGLRYVYGPAAEWLDLQGIVAEIEDLQSDPADSRRFWLNQVTSSSDAWLSGPEWAIRADPGRQVDKRTLVVLGFDGSRSRARGVTDATALVGVTVEDGHLFTIGIWEQPEGPAGQGWAVPVAEVDAAVRSAFDNYKVVGFYADPARWEAEIARWEATYGSKLRVKSSTAHPIEWWMTGGRTHLIVRATAQLHSAVLDGPMTHDGSYALTRHVLAARRRTSKGGLQIGKEHPDSSRKIDAAVASVLAWQARLDALAVGVRRGSARPRIIVLA